MFVCSCELVGARTFSACCNLRLPQERQRSRRLVQTGTSISIAACTGMYCATPRLLLLAQVLQWASHDTEISSMYSTKMEMFPCENALMARKNSPTPRACSNTSLSRRGPCETQALCCSGLPGAPARCALCDQRNLLYRLGSPVLPRACRARLRRGRFVGGGGPGRFCHSLAY